MKNYSYKILDILYISLCSILLTLVGCSTQSSSSSMLGKQVPLVQLYSLDGTQSALSSDSGKTTILLFWAQWCSRSQQVIRSVDQFAAQSKNHVASIAISIDKADKLALVKRFIKDAQLNHLDHKFSGNDIYDEAYVAFDVGEVPTIFIINERGQVVAHGTNFDVIENYFRKEL